MADEGPVLVAARDDIDNEIHWNVKKERLSSGCYSYFVPPDKAARIHAVLREIAPSYYERLARKEH